MKAYLVGIASAVVGAIALAFLVATTGHDWIGYSVESRIVVGGIFGVVVGSIAGLPRLLKPVSFSSPAATIGSAMVAAFVLWLAECLLMPGTNAGLSLYHGAITLLIGGWVGAWMAGGTKAFAKQLG